MLIYDFVEIPRSFADVRRVLTSVDHGWMAAGAAASYAVGEELLLRVGPRQTGVSREVRLEVGEIHSRGDSLVVPIFWVAVSASALFPKLEADMIFAPLDSQITQLCFQGSYDPPLGGFGRAADRLWLHRIAERTIRHFVEQMAQSLSSMAGENPAEFQARAS